MPVAEDPRAISELVHDKSRITCNSAGDIFYRALSEDSAVDDFTRCNAGDACVEIIPEYTCSGAVKAFFQAGVWSINATKKADFAEWIGALEQATCARVDAQTPDCAGAADNFARGDPTCVSGRCTFVEGAP